MTRALVTGLEVAGDRITAVRYRKVAPTINRKNVIRPETQKRYLEIIEQRDFSHARCPADHTVLEKALVHTLIRNRVADRVARLPYAIAVHYDSSFAIRR